jgi:UDP-glucose 4-epimerase
VAELRRVSKRRAPIVLGTSPNARFQSRDLRFRSVVWPELDQLATTTLAAGIAATFDDVAAALRAPEQAR